VRWKPGVRVRRLTAAMGVAGLVAAGALGVHAVLVEPRALAAAGRACDAAAVRAGAAIGSLLAFKDADGALQTVREVTRETPPVSIVILDKVGRVAAARAVPVPGLSHVARAEVFFESARVGSLALGFSLESVRAEASRARWRSAVAAAGLALLGAAALAATLLDAFRRSQKRVSAEQARLSGEKEQLAVRASEMEARLERERRDRRWAESALSGRDLFEIERTEILEMIARGEGLDTILSSLAALVEHRRPQSLCVVAPLRQGLLPVGSAEELVSPFGGRRDRVHVGSTTPPLALAVEEKRLVVTRDAADDPLWESSRETFAPHGIAACWTVPIEAGTGTVFGTLSLLLAEPVVPEVADISLLTNAARLAAIAIEQRQLAEQLAFQARFDRLTNLPNRVYLEEALHRAVSRAARRGERVMLLFLDLDRFKRVNDIFGHAGGDALLAEVGLRLASTIGEGDLVARMGGDEFCILHTSPPEGPSPEDLSRRLLDAFRAPFDLLGQEFVVGASIGVSVFPEDAHDAMALQMHADAAMYAAKEEAGSGYHIFDPSQTFRGGERLRLENDLRRAIAGGELTLVFQPQTDLAGTLTGAEALLRWHHPVLGDVRPARFVPIAEESGLIEALGAWALEEVCRQIAAWRRAGLAVVPISINVSSVQFSHADLVQTVESSLARHAVPASLLRLELTESLLIKDVPSTMVLLGRLKGLGIGLAVDDFGTGYSSLSYLQLLPVDEIKIDQAFLRELGTPSESASRSPKLVQSMISLGHSLGLVVVAEGVETNAQIDFLRRAGCDRVQGFAVGRPMPGDALTRLLAIPSRPLAL
jgi:diguanylate cyclase (GGDEF)-like protein